jgi:hypothetical protein
VISVVWDVDAETVAIDLLSDTGELLQTEALESNGTLDLSPVIARGTLILRLRAIRGGNTATRSVRIAVTCRYEWFFVPVPDGLPACAPNDRIISDYDMQKFQYGVAFYIASTHTVYFLADKGAKLVTYPYKDSNFQPALAPTPLLDPVDHIGAVWHTQRWTDGTSMLGVVGWATAPEKHYQGSLQPGLNPGDLFIQDAAGTIFILSNAGTWANISQPTPEGTP